MYWETEERFRHLLPCELGCPLEVVKTYAHKMRRYWPYTKPTKGSTYGSRWSAQEDNLLMEVYQTSPFAHVCELLPRRNPLAIRKRASFLGVTR
jgi:hypothetical protein